MYGTHGIVSPDSRSCDEIVYSIGTHCHGESDTDVILWSR